MIVNPFIESMSPSDMRQLQGRRALELVHRAYESNPFYRRSFERIGLQPRHVRTLADFTRLVPFTDKAALLADQEAHPPFGTRAVGEIRQFHLTSGTTGIGQEIHTLTAGDVEALAGAAYYQFGWAGIASGDVIALTLPASTTLAAPYFNQAVQAIGAIPLYLGALDAEPKLRTMMRFQPKALVAVPAYLHRLEVVCRSLGIDPVSDLPSLDSIFTATEPFSIDWAQRVEAFWGARVHEWYGATQAAGVFMCTCEGGVLARDERTGRGVLHSLDHRVLVEVLDIETGLPVAEGEVGEAVVTVLHRESFPCIRFRMGDRIQRLVADSCGCHRPFEAYESGTIARYDDMIKIRGLNVWPSLVDGIVFADKLVSEYRGLVATDPETGRERVVVTVEFVESLDADTADRRLRGLQDAIKAQVGLSISVNSVPPGSLPRYDFKVRRWLDERREGRDVVHHVALESR